MNTKQKRILYGRRKTREPDRPSSYNPPWDIRTIVWEAPPGLALSYKVFVTYFFPEVRLTPSQIGVLDALESSQREETAQPAQV